MELIALPRLPRHLDHKILDERGTCANALPVAPASATATTHPLLPIHMGGSWFATRDSVRVMFILAP